MDIAAYVQIGPHSINGKRGHEYTCTYILERGTVGRDQRTNPIYNADGSGHDEVYSINKSKTATVRSLKGASVEEFEGAIDHDDNNTHADHYDKRPRLGQNPRTEIIAPK